MTTVSHKATGLRKVLDLSIAYKAFQFLLGDYKLYRKIISFIPSLENKRVLDIGCGNGRLLDFLPPSVNYTGYDFNEDYIRKAKAKYQNRNAQFFVADINNDPDLPKADIAFAIGVLHHLNDASCKNFLRSTRDHLNPGGVLITVDPVYVKNQNRIAKAIIKSDRGQCVREAKGYLELGDGIFNNQDYKVLNNVTNIPYNHVVIKSYV